MLLYLLMNTRLPDYISYPIFGAIVGTFLFVIPFLGPLLFLPLISLSELYDYLIPGNFGETGVHVEVGFAWIGLKTVWAWLFYSSFFFIVGLVVGVLKHATKGKKLWFIVSLIGILAMASLLQSFINKSKVEQELVALVTPTETLFVCDEWSSMEVKDGGVIKFEDDGTFLTNALVGYIDVDTNSFTFREFGYVNSENPSKVIEQYKNDLNYCLNVNGYSISDLYTINPYSDSIEAGN